MQVTLAVPRKTAESNMGNMWGTLCSKGETGGEHVGMQTPSENRLKKISEKDVGNAV